MHNIIHLMAVFRIYLMKRLSLLLLALLLLEFCSTIATTAITRLDFIVLIPVPNLRPRVKHAALLGHAPANTGGHAGAGSLWLGSAASDSLCAP